MFKNAFANLQKVGKSLMLPVSVLPIAGILLGVGSANFSWLPAVVSHVMAEAGGSVFANMPLIFAIGVALGFTNNDGVSALAAVVAYGIMVKTMAVVAPLVLHLPAEEIASKHLADTGVLGGIISAAPAHLALAVGFPLCCRRRWPSGCANVNGTRRTEPDPAR